MKRSVIFTIGLLLVMLWAVQGMVYAGEYVLWSDTTQWRSNIPKRCKKLNGTPTAILVRNNSGSNFLGEQCYEYSIRFRLNKEEYSLYGHLWSHETKRIALTASGSEVCLEGGYIRSVENNMSLGSFQIIVRTE